MLNQILVDSSSFGIINGLKDLYQELVKVSGSGMVKLNKEQREALNQDLATIEELVAKIQAQIELLK